MRAVLLREPGDPDVLYLGEAPTPEPKAGEVLIRVHATAVNRADTMQRRGNYPVPEGASEILGLECAGIVERVGEGVERWSVGDRVMALLAGGGYAEYAVADARHVMPVPEGMALDEAAAVPEVFLTAFQALYWLGEMQEGDHVLVHAGGSGVGTSALQLVREAGAHPYATLSGPKVPRALALGAEEAVDYEQEAFDDVLLEATGGHGADVIVDFIGASYFHQNARALARDGRLVLLSMLGGRHVDDVDLGILFRKRATLRFSTLRSRTDAYKARLVADFTERILPLLDAGRVGPILDRYYGWADVADAHRHIEANRNVGKVVLRVAE